MGFINEQCINTHIVKVGNFVGPSVELLLCLGRSIGNSFCFFLCVFFAAITFLGLLTVLVFIFQVFQLLLQLAFSRGILCSLGLLENELLFVNLLLNKGALAFLAVWHHFKNRLRNNYYIPVVILDFSIKSGTPLYSAVGF